MSNRYVAVLRACLLVLVAGRSASADSIVDDGFPGYAEETTWDYSWNVGVGSTTFDANAPGFAHLNLDGPAPSYGTIYHNAELINREMTGRVPPYCDLQIRLRNSNNNGWDSPGGPNDPDPNYGIGSRGWGFWNASMDPSSRPMNTIWFTSISPQSDPLVRGSRLWVIRNNWPIAILDLGIDLTAWHTYRIQWRADYLAAYVDDLATPIWLTTDPAQIPDSTEMSFTVWVDNYVLSMPTGFPNFEIGYLDVPDIQQYIDVDYVKIYTRDYALTLDVINGSWGSVGVEPNWPTYPEGTPVTLTAQPGEGRSFAEWHLDDPNHPDDDNYVLLDTNNPIAVEMTCDRHVTAVFRCGTSAILPLAVAGLLGGAAIIRRFASR